MASIRKRNDKWQAQVRRVGMSPRTKSFINKADAIRWVRQFVHVAIDDASRIAFSQILPDERKESATAFLVAAVTYYASLGVPVTRVMTDNGSCYRSKAFAKACRTIIPASCHLVHRQGGLDGYRQ